MSFLLSLIFSNNLQKQFETADEIKFKSSNSNSGHENKGREIEVEKEREVEVKEEHEIKAEEGHKIKIEERHEVEEEGREAEVEKEYEVEEGCEKEAHELYMSSRLI
ncbi:hypothetical protein Glove_156g33 [Diversispora epigaea]|uniref:Uncharacterized protein n=1 Tax=Diversispora epigaea TaxID=1348612 RepID=A0A397J1J3_9GLOM|nr:hypothetical protein Glove_156g33 [Diversispora epigaea]